MVYENKKDSKCNHTEQHISEDSGLACNVACVEMGIVQILFLE